MIFIYENDEYQKPVYVHVLYRFEYPPDANHGFYANSAIISCFIASEYDSINNKRYGIIISIVYKLMHF